MNRTSVYCLHKRSGSARMYDVKYTDADMKTAESAKISASNRKFWHKDTDEGRQDKIVYHLNHTVSESGTSIVNVASNYSVDFPTSNKQWLERANQPVSKSNSALTLILDLDDTFLSQTKHGAFNKADKFNDGVFSNEVAMRQVNQFQARGHKIKVVTNTAYSFLHLKHAFSRNGVTLEFKSYFNLKHPARTGLSKSKFITAFAFDNSNLHVDNLEINQSSSTHFHLVTPEAPFPNLS